MWHFPSVSWVVLKMVLKLKKWMWESLQSINNNEEQRWAQLNKPLASPCWSSLLAGCLLVSVCGGIVRASARLKAAALKGEGQSLQLTGSVPFRQLSSLNFVLALKWRKLCLTYSTCVSLIYIIDKYRQSMLNRLHI